MAVRTSKCNIHIERETPRVYLYVPRPLSFVVGRQRSRISENGRDESRDEVLLRWLPRSRDLTPWDFYYGNALRTLSFYWLYPQDQPELRSRIIVAISEVVRDMLQRVWAERGYLLDVYCVTKVDIQSTYEACKNKLTYFLFAPVHRILQSFPTFKCADFMNCVRELWITLCLVSRGAKSS